MLEPFENYQLCASKFPNYRTVSSPPRTQVLLNKQGLDSAARTVRLCSKPCLRKIRHSPRFGVCFQKPPFAVLWCKNAHEFAHFHNGLLSCRPLRRGRREAAGEAEQHESPGMLDGLAKAIGVHGRFVRIPGALGVPEKQLPVIYLIFCAIAVRLLRSNNDTRPYFCCLAFGYKLMTTSIYLKKFLPSTTLRAPRAQRLFHPLGLYCTLFCSPSPSYPVCCCAELCLQEIDSDIFRCSWIWVFR